MPPNYRIGHGTLFLQHPTDDVSVVLHMGGRGLLGVGAGVYWRGIGMSVLTNVSQLGMNGERRWKLARIEIQVSSAAYDLR